MAKFSKASRDKLETCHAYIQSVMNEAIKHFDFTVIYGERDETTQNRLFLEKKSKAKYPDSKHNVSPSEAIDIAPCPINWNDRERFTLLAGFVIGIAITKGINLRWGGDWDRDTEVNDNEFDDLGHFELYWD